MSAARVVGKKGRGRWKQRLVLTLALVGVLLLGALATLDWWLPPLATRVAGAEFSSREVSYGRSVEWRDLDWADQSSGVTFHAGRARIDAPTRILLNGLSTKARIEDWTLTVAPPAGTTRRADAKPFGWPELIDVLRMVSDRLDGRLRGAWLKNGRVFVAGEEIVLRSAQLTPRAGGGLLVWRGEWFPFEVDLAENRAWLAHDGSRARLRLAEIARDRAKGTIEWADNTATIEAAFVEGEWVPERFELEGRGWTVPAARLRLPDDYAELRGGFRVSGSERTLHAVVDAVARPGREDLPVVTLQAEARATPGELRLERLLLEAPQLRASLSAPLVWRAGAGWATESELEFVWSAELGPLSDERVRGHVEGTARWLPGAEGATGSDWRVEWLATAAGLAWSEVEGKVLDARLSGETTMAATRVIELVARDEAGAAELEASGIFFHRERRIQDGRATLAAPGAWFAPWLPEEASFEAVELTARVEGALGESPGGLEVEAEGSVVGARFAEWMTDRATVAFSGNPLGDSRATLALVRGAAALDAELALSPGRVVAERLDIRRDAGSLLRLAEPARVSHAAGERAVAAEWGAEGGGRLALRWEAGRAAAVFIQNLDTSWIEVWRDAEPWPSIAARSVAVEGRTAAGGWIEGTGEADLAWTRGDRTAGWARAKGAAGAEGLRLESVTIGREQDVLASGAGLAPWRLRVGEGIEPEPVEGGEWSLRLESRPEAMLWDDLAKLANIELEQPAVAAELSGPALEPSGHLHLSAERVRLHGEGLPDEGLELSGLRVEAEVSRGDFEVRRLEARVDGQRVEAEGRVVLEEGDWPRLRERPYVWLRDHAEARVRVPGAEVSALARYLPRLLAPAGTLAAELTLSRGAELDGWLRLSDGSTRPLGGFGVLQDIDVELALDGRAVRIERMRAMAGGQAVSMSGGATRVPGAMPLLDLRLRAERFPLVRRPGLLLRGDLDLTIKTETGVGGAAGPTRVGGEVRLRDSLFLADIRPLISTGGGSAAAVRARPPYFSVDTPPLADWELALRVGGEEFLRLRTPIFEGTGSARFELTGTLREPRAVGEFWVEEGNILFPFATFAVQEGAVRLRASDPYTPMLDFRATGRRLGYDLRLELGGTADAPQLQLFSSPPLDAEALILMVTAGATPSDGQGSSSSSQRLAAVGAYLGRDLLRTLGVGGADEERLTFSSGEKVSRQGRETYGFEFKLNDRWSLTGEYDEFDAYNVGIKRRLRAAPPDVPEELETGDEEADAQDEEAVAAERAAEPPTKEGNTE